MQSLKLQEEINTLREQLTLTRSQLETQQTYITKASQVSTEYCNHKVVGSNPGRDPVVKPLSKVLNPTRSSKMIYILQQTVVEMGKSGKLF